MRATTWLVGAFLVLGCGSSPEPKGLKQDYDRGCLVSINTTTRTCLFELAIIVGTHSNGTDLWLYLPGRPDSEFVGLNGKMRAINFPEDRVLKSGHARIIRGVLCKCPR